MKKMTIINGILEFEDNVYAISNTEIGIGLSAEVQKSNKRVVVVISCQGGYNVIEASGLIITKEYEAGPLESGFATVGSLKCTNFIMPPGTVTTCLIDKRTLLAELLEQKYPQLKD